MAATPNCQIVESAVLAAFPDARFGRYNCRHIGSNPMRSWSQHAGSEPARRYFSNALDIWHVDHKPAGKPADSSPAHQAWLRAVRAFITLHFGGHVGIVDQMLGPGDNAAHANHIHMSTWPKMKSSFWYKPPCKGGTLVVIHEDGTSGNTFGDPPPPPPPLPTMDVNMAYADTLNLNDWVATLRPEDIDQLFDLGVHTGDRTHWKALLIRHPTAGDADAWENFRRTTSARIGFWQPDTVTVTGVGSPSSYTIVGEIRPT